MKKLFALLLAVAMMLTLTACGDKDDDKGVANKPEDVAEEFIKAEMLGDIKNLKPLCVHDYEKELQDETIDEYGDEESFFEEFGEEVGEKITSWNDAYAAAKKMNKEYLVEDYGKNYRINAKAGEVEGMDADTLDDLIDEVIEDHEDYVDEKALQKVEEGKIVPVTITISGTDEDGEDVEDEENYEVYVIKIGGKWKVADYDYIYNDEY